MKYSGFLATHRYDDDGVYDPLSIEERLLMLGGSQDNPDWVPGRVLWRIVFGEALQLTSENGELEIEYDSRAIPVRVTHGGREVAFTLEAVQ